MRPVRRPHRRRRLVRKGAAPSTSSAEEIPEGIPVDPNDPDESTLIDKTAVAEPVKAPVSPSAKTAILEPPGKKEAPQDETVEVLAIREKTTDVKGETAGALDGDLEEPDAPDRLSFRCTCGATIEATKKTYDTRQKCESCKTLLLVSLIWNPGKNAYEIEPFRVGDVPDLP